ncbi:MAG: hypothetical protein IJ188_08440 [Clostridia bacterium]|nr:hypothetical protein [Clostridia bacterium]
MKKWIALIVTLILAMGSLFSAYADEAAARIFDAAAQLLTATENVTLTGSATFSLDGEAFKYLETSYVQDGVNSKWVLDLSSPRRDGSLRENGFTAIANNRYKYGMEVCHPGTYVVAEDNPQSAILRSSAQLNQLIALGHSVFAQVPALSEDAFSFSDGRHLTVRLDGDQIPDSISNILSLGIWLAVQRTMNIVDDSISAPPYPEEAVKMEDYITPTQAIINMTEKYELSQFSMDAEMNEMGLFTEVNGTARIALHTFLDGVHELHISFAGNASDYGASTVSAFDPDEYGVIPAEGTYLPLNAYSIGSGAARTQEEATPQMAWYENRAKFIFEEAGFDLDLMTNIEAQQDDEDVTVIINNANNSFFAYCVLNPDGSLVEFRNITNPWSEEEIIREREDITNDLIEECCVKLNRYMEAIQPGLSNEINGYKLDAIFQDNEQTFVRLVDISTQSLFIVRLAPSWRVDTLHIPRSNG